MTEVKCVRCKGPMSRSEVERGWKLCNTCRAEDRRKKRSGSVKSK